MTRIGGIGYATRQGIGNLNRWFYQEGIITDYAIVQYTSKKNYYEWYPANTPIITSRPFANLPEIQELVKKVDAFLFFETPFDFSFLNYCRQNGKKTFVVPMYEWWPVHPPDRPDVFICPSVLDQEYFPGSPYLPIPVPRQIKWQKRTKALRFLHNAGGIGSRCHKGSQEILKAIEFVKSPISITFTCQNKRGFEHLIEESGIKDKIPSNVEVIFDLRSDDELAWEDLYKDCDVFIMAEKYNGLSLPLMEARASGLLVMTSNRYPMNNWLPTWPLIDVESYTTVTVAGTSYNAIEEAYVTPQAIAAKIDEAYGQDITEYSLSGRIWAEENSWDALKPQWLELLNS